MAAIFPEQMNKINPSDVPGSLQVLERYIQYMVERLEFDNAVTMKSLTAAGTTSQDIVKMFLTYADDLAWVKQMVNNLSNNVISYQRNVARLETELEALTARVTALEGGTEV